MAKKRETPHDMALRYRISGLLRAGCIQEALTLVEHENIPLPKEEVERCIARTHALAARKEHIHDNIAELLRAVHAAKFTAKDPRFTVIVAFEVANHADIPSYILEVLLAAEDLVPHDELLHLTRTVVLAYGHVEEASALAEHYGFAFRKEDWRACGDGLLARRAAALYPEASDESEDDPEQLEEEAIRAYERATDTGSD